VKGDFDPEDTAAIGRTLNEFLRHRLGEVDLRAHPAPIGNGLDTYIYAFHLRGDLPEEWSGPLVLRIYPSAEQGPKARREVDIQTFVADRGYPAPRPLAVSTNQPPLGLPFMIMPRVPGAPALDRMKNPLAIGGVVRRLANEQARLHQLPAEGCPLPSEPPLVERMLGEMRADAGRFEMTDVGGQLEWAERNCSLVAEETSSVLHNDFHPLNVLLDGDSFYVLDWSDAAVGDRHCDLARTLALFWLAPPLAPSKLERTILTLLRGYLVRAYVSAYRKVYQWTKSESVTGRRCTLFAR